MATENTHKFERLLEKYRANNLTHEEFQDFVLMIGKNGTKNSEQLMDQLYRDDWSESKNILRHIQKVRNHVSRRRLIRHWVMRSAAALLLLVTVWLVWPDRVPEDLVYGTGYGETRNIELPDGSQVLLNANSQIVWTGDWERQNARKVTLTGEAFFDVVKADHMHFEVITPDIKVDVMGTEFNVRSRGAETDVYLKEGKVRLEVNGPENQKMEMKPGDFVRFNHMNLTLESFSHSRKEDKASWVEGMLEFQNVSVPDILEEFENLYGKKFVLGNPELQDKRLDLSLPYADWDLVRKALEIALDVEFTISGDSIIVRKQK
ncbi:MAG TPA: FecR domain-containing protein [Membranihabitans sp.]|nr:FecR domain-containing protein [Membranihabitans sp.]